MTQTQAVFGTSTLTWQDVKDMRARLPDLILFYKGAKLQGAESRAAKIGNEIYEIGNRLSRELARCSLDDLVAKQSHGYRPTLRGAANSPEAMLAEIYDLIAEARGLELRAYRGN